MKKLLCAVLVVVMVLSLAACGKKLKGTYEAEIDAFVLKYTATYEFSGSKVEITKKCRSAPAPPQSPPHSPQWVPGHKPTKEQGPPPARRQRKLPAPNRATY